METILNNGSLTVTLAGAGAEIQSIKNEKGTEELWQADPSV